MKRKDFNDVMNNIKCSDEFRNRMKIVLSDPDAAPDSAGGDVEVRSSGISFAKFAAIAAAAVLLAGSSAVLLSKPSQKKQPAAPSKSDDAAVIVEGSTETTTDIAASKDKKPADAKEAFESIPFMKACEVTNQEEGVISYAALSLPTPTTISCKADIAKIGKKLLRMEWDPIDDPGFTNKEYFRISAYGNSLQINEQGEMRVNGAVFKAASLEEQNELNLILLDTIERNLGGTPEGVRWKIARAQKELAYISGKFKYEFTFHKFETVGNTFNYVSTENGAAEGDYYYSSSDGHTSAKYKITRKGSPEVISENEMSAYYKKEDEFTLIVNEKEYKTLVDRTDIETAYLNEYYNSRPIECTDITTVYPDEYYNICSMIDKDLTEAEDPRCVFVAHPNDEDYDYCWYPNIIPNGPGSEEVSELDLSEATNYFKLSLDPETGLPIAYAFRYGEESTEQIFRLTDYEIVNCFWR